MYYYSVTKKKSCSIDKTQKHYVEKKRQTQNVHEPIYVNIYKKNQCTVAKCRTAVGWGQEWR